MRPCDHCQDFVGTIALGEVLMYCGKCYWDAVADYKDNREEIIRKILDTPFQPNEPESVSTRRTSPWPETKE